MRWNTGSWQLPHFYYGIQKGIGDLAVGNRKVYMAKLREWQQASPEAAEPLILQGGAHIWYGWQARGDGFADTVTDEGWRIFRKELQVAVDCLEQAKVLNPNDPHIYAELISCSIGLSWDQSTMEKLLAEGLRVEPLYQPTIAGAVQYLLPRWNGTPYSIQQLADRLAAEAEGTDADKVYAMVAACCRNWESIDELKSFHLDWKRVNAGFEALREEFPDSNWFLNLQTFWACAYGEKETAAALFNAMEQGYDGYVWHNQEQFRQWRIWAVANGPLPEGDGVAETVDDVQVPSPVEFTPEKLRIAALVFIVPLAGSILLLVIAVIALYVLRRRSARRAS
jgi:hypothetical protein